MFHLQPTKRRHVIACRWPLIFIWFWFKTTEICSVTIHRPESTITRLAVPYASQQHMGGRCLPAPSSCWFFQRPQHCSACRCIASVSITPLLEVVVSLFGCSFDFGGVHRRSLITRGLCLGNKQGLQSNCVFQASHGTGFSGLGARVQGCCPWALGGLSIRGTQAWFPHAWWAPPGPGTEPCPLLAGRILNQWTQGGPQVYSSVTTGLRCIPGSQNWINGSGVILSSGGQGKIVNPELQTTQACES